jgi:hypothetical protein
MAPSGPAVMPVGWEFAVSPAVNSVICPAGVMRPMRPGAADSVNQRVAVAPERDVGQVRAGRQALRVRGDDRGSMRGGRGQRTREHSEESETERPCTSHTPIIGRERPMA